MEFQNGISISHIKTGLSSCLDNMSGVNDYLLSVIDRLDHRDKMATGFLADIVDMMGACRVMTHDFLTEVHKAYDPESMSLSQAENDEIDAIEVDDDMNMFY